MSGTFCISAEAIWMPTGWVFDGVLGRVSDQLDAVQAPLAMKLLEAERHSESAYINFERLDSIQLAAFLDAAETAFNIAFLEGYRPFDHIEYFVRFMWSFSDLKGLLRTDSRLLKRAATGMIKINDQTLWAAPSCIFDLVMEHMAVRIRASNTHLASELFVARTVEDGGQCDLRSFDIARYASVLAAAEELQIRYEGGEGGDSYHPSFFREVAEQVTTFRQQLENDNRARG